MACGENSSNIGNFSASYISDTLQRMRFCKGFLHQIQQVKTQVNLKSMSNSKKIENEPGVRNTEVVDVVSDQREGHIMVDVDGLGGQLNRFYMKSSYR